MVGKRLAAARQATGSGVSRLVPIFILGAATLLSAKEKKPVVTGDDTTSPLFNVLDSQYGGKLKDFFILADVIKDPDNPDSELQHVLRVNYDKDRSYGKMNVIVRAVKKPTEEQMKTYSTQALFEFGEYDLEKFVKSDVGPYGKPGDVYLQAKPGFPLAQESITDEVRNAYDVNVNKYILPALQKK
jgi:hypothetical protein